MVWKVAPPNLVPQFTIFLELLCFREKRVGLPLRNSMESKTYQKMRTNSAWHSMIPSVLHQRCFCLFFPSPSSYFQYSLSFHRALHYSRAFSLTIPSLSSVFSIDTCTIYFEVGTIFSNSQLGFHYLCSYKGSIPQQFSLFLWGFSLLPS